jgi:hypothetical protein
MIPIWLALIGNAITFAAGIFAGYMWWWAE